MSEPAPNRAGLADALAAFQRDLPKVGKGNEANAGTYKYKYADLADVSAAVLPALALHGLSWSTLPTIQDDGKFVLRYKLLHTSGESESGTWPLPGPSSTPQVLGSALTYARRYCLCAVTGVSPDDDDDGGAAHAAVLATPSEPEPNWTNDIELAVAAGDRSGLAALWKLAGKLRPGDQELLAQMKAAGTRLGPATPPKAAEPAVAVDPRSTGKTRRELEAHLFALLWEGGVSDTKTGRASRLRIMSRLCNKVPEAGSSKEFTDGQLADIIGALVDYREAGLLTETLASLGDGPHQQVPVSANGEAQPLAGAS